MPANGREREPLERGRERGRERERKDRVKQDRGRGGNGWTGERPAASLRTTWPHRPCRHHSASPASFQRSRLAFQPANALGSPTGLLPDRSGPRSPTPLSLDLRTRYSSPLPTSLISCSSASPPSRAVLFVSSDVRKRNGEGDSFRLTLCNGLYSSSLAGCSKVTTSLRMMKARLKKIRSVYDRTRSRARDRIISRYRCARRETVERNLYFHYPVSKPVRSTMRQSYTWFVTCIRYSGSHARVSSLISSRRNRWIISEKRSIGGGKCVVTRIHTRYTYVHLRQM